MQFKCTSAYLLLRQSCGYFMSFTYHRQDGRHPNARRKRLLFAVAAIGISLLGAPLLFVVRQHLIRPPRTAMEQQLFKGIVYRRSVRSLPRPIVLHIVTIDLTAPGIGVLVTPGLPTPETKKLRGLEAPIPVEVPARTTEEFLSEFKLQLAINANFYYPVRDNGPWDYYPRSGEMVNAVGQAISNGSEYSAGESRWPVLCFSTNKRAQILSSRKCPKGTDQAVAGSAILVAFGEPVSVDKNSPDNNGLHPRTVVAIDQLGKKLWLVIVDGRQPRYSEGVTLAEMAKILVELGVDTAMNLDGGNSTTLVVANRKQPCLLNSPIRNRIPMLQRSVANHLGIYARPLD